MPKIQYRCNSCKYDVGNVCSYWVDQYGNKAGSRKLSELQRQGYHCPHAPNFSGSQGSNKKVANMSHMEALARLKKNGARVEGVRITMPNAGLKSLALIDKLKEHGYSIVM